jgi:hypothetical protein
MAERTMRTLFVGNQPITIKEMVIRLTIFT